MSDFARFENVTSHARAMCLKVTSSKDSENLASIQKIIILNTESCKEQKVGRHRHNINKTTGSVYDSVPTPNSVEIERIHSQHDRFFKNEIQNGNDTTNRQDVNM